MESEQSIVHTPVENVTTSCRHCHQRNEPHKYVCDCGHAHNSHVYCGPCVVKKCGCDCYSQVKKRIA